MVENPKKGKLYKFYGYSKVMGYCIPVGYKSDDNTINCKIVYCNNEYLIGYYKFVYILHLFDVPEKEEKLVKALFL